MTTKTGMLSWSQSDRYFDCWFIGSEDENGGHLPDASGWPYSVYRKAAQTGVGDMVLCHGIQDMDDALGICAALRLMALR